MNVGIIDSGIDLARLYGGERHGYAVTWIPVETVSFDAVSRCDLIVVPAGTDSVLLHRCRDIFRLYLAAGGWILCFDGMAPGLFDGVRWTHTPTSHREQSLHACAGPYSFLLDGVSLEGLACKDGIRGWWCEGELQGNGLMPLVVDERDRVVAAMRPEPAGTGMLVVTAAARLPAFADDPALAPNRLFANLLALRSRSDSRERNPVHLYVHSGNWAQRSFLDSPRFGHQFTGVHWSVLDDAMLAGAASVWIPWESNTRALKRCWPMLERAVNAGATLVVEDLRDDWIPGVAWEPRPVDSSWWREGRELAVVKMPELGPAFRKPASSFYFWHHHGVFRSPPEARPLLVAPDGMHVLSLVPAAGTRRGCILLGTLDATFEFGAGKIPETGDYVDAVLTLVGEPGDAGISTPPTDQRTEGP
jgi:hypothetical protein